MGEAHELSGRRVFVVEDETLVAAMIEAMVEELGAVVIGSETRIADALSFIDSRHGDIDIALLDLNLGEGRSYDIAQAVSRHDIPIVFSTGYTDGAIDEPWRNRPLLSKPFRLADLEGALARALAARVL
ncbi:response regulator [Starkeya koreensis]|uniref:Response regulator n=1 Tax=Ancylobacter koreensis TaxID=266121 RepID=A0ABT0DP66_9HYPH|nr:response regulator [Ancylobacter koreensis]MCK0209070.1 response regulator [Ancylobacter koreensis]